MLKTILIYSFTILSYINLRSPRLDPKKIAYAINCGSSNPFYSKDGFTYVPDNHFKGKTEVAKWNEDLSVKDVKVKYTEDRNIYMTERWSRANFAYYIPIREEGNYVLITQHAEHAFSDNGKRVWDFFLGNMRVKKEVDVHRMIGKHSATNIYIPFLLVNKKIYFKGEECPGAYNHKKKLIALNLKHLDIDNPMINGIVLFRGELKDTDYPYLDEIRREFDQHYDAEKRKKNFKDKYLKQISTAKLKPKKRNDNIFSFEDFDVIYDEEELQRSYGWIYLIVLMFIMTFFVYFVMLVKNDIQEMEGNENLKKKQNIEKKPIKKKKNVKNKNIKDSENIKKKKKNPQNKKKKIN